jgi:hypothetical protein
MKCAVCGRVGFGDVHGRFEVSENEQCYVRPVLPRWVAGSGERRPEEDRAGARHVDTKTSRFW